MIAPAIKAALSYVPLPTRTWVPLEQLNLNPMPNKNVPIFVRQFGSVRQGIPKGAHWLEAPLRLTSLVTFLFSDKKVT